ncbi:MAG: hypothetical protein ACLRY5_00040 [Zhenhengia sp.]
MKIQEQLQKVVEHLQVRPITMEDIKVPIPTVPEGIGIEFLGADYKQIIDDEGNIHKPLVNSKVIIDFRIFCEEEEVWTKGIEVTVPGSYGGEIGENSKPYVIPEIKEWIGLEGQCLIASESTIRVGQINREVLLPIATILKQDMSEMMGLDLR